METIYGFGVSQDASVQSDTEETDKPPLLPIHARGPTLPPPEFANYVRREKKGYGLSTASLNNITTLHMRMRTIRTPTAWVCGCAGLRIVHLDSSVEILGRWDPRDKQSISKLYDSSEGMLKTVTFHLARIERETHVENITVEVTNNPWDCQPLDSSMVDPTNPPSHSWDSKGGEFPEVLTCARMFDCSQAGQVSVSPTLLPLPLPGSKLDF